MHAKVMWMYMATMTKFTMNIYDHTRKFSKEVAGHRGSSQIKSAFTKFTPIPCNKYWAISYCTYPCYGHFFAEYLCILENNGRQVQNEFSKFENLTKKYAMYTLSCVFLIVIKWLGQFIFFTSWEFDSQQYQQISIKKNLLFWPDLLRIILSQTSVVGTV
jgi:hypothetical protein